jgi:hypothetical protein
MGTKSTTFSARGEALAPILFLLAVLLGPRAGLGQGAGLTVTVGPANADVIGTDHSAIQKAIDRVAAAGGGTVEIKAGTYLLANSVRLASHLTLRGEGPEKTLLRKAPGVRSKLKLDADYGEMLATVEDVHGFTPGMGVTVLDKVNPSGWTPSVRTILRIEGNTRSFQHLPASGGVRRRRRARRGPYRGRQPRRQWPLGRLPGGRHLLFPFPPYDHSQLCGAELPGRRHQHPVRGRPGRG